MADNVLLLILGSSTLAQLIAAWIALRQMAEVSGRYRLAWACVSLSLMLMVQRRFAPLWRLHVENIPTPFADAWFGLAISVAMATGVFGIRRLFIDMKEQEATLDALARTDALTGLPNRRETLERLRGELERSQRSGHPIALLMFDIDHFKQFNDTYGHATGDRVLQAVAAVANAGLRRIDCCGRIGGEEFLVVLPEAAHDEAAAIAERLRIAIEAERLVADAVALQVTISIGIAFHPGSAESPSPERLIHLADRALYAAKEGGRNRVVSASESKEC